MRHRLKKGNSRDHIFAVLSALSQTHDWSIEIKQWRDKRSNAQLAYFYAGIVNPICEETGNEVQDIHDFLCGEYWGWHEVKVMGQRKKKPVQTLTSPEPVSVENMVNFCEWCVMRMANEGIILEPPREVNV